MRHTPEHGHPWPFVLVTTGIYLTARVGLATTVTDDLKRMLERPPTLDTRVHPESGRGWSGRTEEGWRHGRMKVSKDWKRG